MSSPRDDDSVTPVDSASRLAIDGGTPVRDAVLPYGRHWIDEQDLAEVRQVLESGWLTTGPMVAAFEAAVAEHAGATHCVAVNSGTAALHAAMAALDLAEGDEVIVPVISFVATASCVVMAGGRPVFVDVDSESLLLDLDQVREKLTPRTRAVIAVDYAGQPCDYPALKALCHEHGVAVVADACHSLGANLDSRAVGSLADATCFSFHPVKHVTTTEGGALTTDDADSALRFRRFRNHGIDVDHHRRTDAVTWEYDIAEVGYNYRLPDPACALGISQLRRLPEFVTRRRQLAKTYDEAFAGETAIRPLRTGPGVEHAYHLYVVQLDLDRLRVDRAQIFRALRAEGIGVNVHYIPIHLLSYYRDRYGTGPGMFPAAERAYDGMVTLPLFPQMTESDIADVVRACTKVVDAYRR